MGQRKFPEGFVWGSASAAHQIEGHNTNSDWWRHELEEGTAAKEPSGAACNSYELFEDDFHLVRGSGQNAVRFSIEWARIEPEPGEFSGEAIDHYREVIGTAQDLGLHTFVTFHHFTNPFWFADKGGWESDESSEIFGRYALTLGKSLGDLLQNVCTINEPSIVASVGYLMGYFPPRKRDLGAFLEVTTNLIKGHAAAFEAMRRTCDAKVGITLSLNDIIAADDTPETRSMRETIHHRSTGVYLNALSTGSIVGLGESEEKVPGIGGTDDFVGVQYYSRMIAGRRRDKESLVERGIGPEDRVTQMGWPWHPIGMARVLEEVAQIGLPIYVTENGIATDDDEERIEFVTLHLEQVHEAVGRGADVRGYFYWSYIDNFEWNEGYRPKFGLIACDRSTFERTPKPSLGWYGSVAKANAL